MNSFRLARQLLRRDWRSGELATLVFALLIAVTAVTGIALVTDRLTQGMVRESAELIGGDLVIRSSREPDPAWLAMGERLGLATARVHTFDSVIFRGDHMLLGAIKAVSDAYPLIGQLRTSDHPLAAPVARAGGPEPGTAWVDPRVLERLDATIGDEIHFGDTVLTLAQILHYEPDQGNSLFQLSPRVLVHEADLQAAGVIAPGSRIRYRYLFQGANSDRLASELEPLLTTGHTVQQPTDGESRATEALVRAIQYIKFSTLMAIVLAAIAIALAARRYSERHYDVSAMLRCLGAPQRAVIKVYVYQLMLVTTATVVLGLALGWLAHLAIVRIISPLLPVALPAAGPLPLASGAGTALLLVGGFALPPLLRLAECSPLRVFRRDLEPTSLSGWTVYGLAGGSQLLLLWLLFGDVGRILLILLATACILFAVGCLIYLGLRRLRRGQLARAGLLGRGIRNLATHAATSTSQVMAFGVTLMILLLIAQLRTGLLEEWRLQLPENAPNHFAFNIFPEDVEAFTALVTAHGRLEPLYPVVLGRLTAINGESPATRQEEGRNQEWNLTWSSQLADDNELVAGVWPPTGDGVSVATEFAERLGVGIGDTLSFDSGGNQFTATITSLRTVVWETLSPNFFLIFSAEQLAQLPATYLTSFYLDPAQRDVLRELVRQFPATTLIEMDALLARFEQVLEQVSLAVELLMLFVLLGGFLVLFATLQSTGDERRHEGALMRALGASRAWLRRAYLLEFGAIGLLAGVLAVTGAEIASAVIQNQVFYMSYRPQPLLWLLVPVGTALLVGTSGYLASRRILAVSPVKILNE
ncbi:MAG: hypothetical protein M0R02_12930 [Bacteroidales bacterium]|nr:hypothetical protein [Bacteroidales bacterium]